MRPYYGRGQVATPTFGLYTSMYKAIVSNHEWLDYYHALNNML